MQAHANVWLISAALGFSGCTLGGGEESDRKPVQKTSNAGAYNAGGSRNAGSGGQFDNGAGAGGTSGAGTGGTGTGGTGGSTAPAGAGANAASGSAGTSSGPTAYCATLMQVRLPSGACVDRIEEFSVAKTPTSIVTGSDGQVWFDDDGSNQLVQLDSEGRVLKRVDCGEGSSPRALVGGHNDTLVWYTDARAKKLHRLTQTTQGSFDLGFTATAIALGEDDQLWATEARQAIYQVRPNGSSVPYLEAPSKGLVVGPDKNVWFPTGALIATLMPEKGTKYFTLSTGSVDELCVGPDRALWFTDGKGDQIGRMDLNGKSQIFDLPFGSGPTRIIMGPDGALWFAESGTNKIGRITVKGDLTEFPIPTSGALPYALTVGGDGNIWFTEKVSGKIGRLLTAPPG